jgi:hypothetical protein
MEAFCNKWKLSEISHISSLMFSKQYYFHTSVTLWWQYIIFKIISFLNSVRHLVF